jgi:hypothetical protein
MRAGTKKQRRAGSPGEILFRSVANTGEGSRMPEQDATRALRLSRKEFFRLGAASVAGLALLAAGCGAGEEEDNGGEEEDDEDDGDGY